MSNLVKKPSDIQENDFFASKNYFFTNFVMLYGNIHKKLSVVLLERRKSVD